MKATLQTLGSAGLSINSLFVRNSKSPGVISLSGAQMFKFAPCQVGAVTH